MITKPLRRQIDYDIETLSFCAHDIGRIGHHAVNLASGERRESIRRVADLEHNHVAVWIKAKLPSSKTSRRLRGITEAGDSYFFPFQLIWRRNIACRDNGVNQSIGNRADKLEPRTAKSALITPETLVKPIGNDPTAIACEAKTPRAKVRSTSRSCFLKKPAS